MPLEIRSGNPFFASHKVRWLQYAAVGVLALAWWRGEGWIAELGSQNEAVADIRTQDLTAQRIAQAALGLSTADVIVGANDTLERIFRKLALSVTDLQVLRALPNLRSHLGQLRPGELLKFSFRNTQLVSLERKLSPIETLQVVREPAGFESQVFVNPIERSVRTVAGVIDSSLLQAAAKAGVSDAIALRIADIFRWDIDFVLDVRPGDRFRVTYEQLQQDGEIIGDGELLAVEFVNNGEVFRAVRYAVEGEAAAFYSPEGKSLRKAFIRAPVDFTRISSRFNNGRRHPILNRIRAHKGTDYAAPMGTPVKAAGDGKIMFVGRKNGYGNVIEIQHADHVETVYGHLSRFTRGLRSGSRVEQGAVIGFVGMTGLATGPHLHYEYSVRGVQKDPQKVLLPKDAPIPTAKLADFRAQAAPLLASLNSGSSRPERSTTVIAGR